MAAQEDLNKRRMWGPRAIGSVVGPLTRPAFRSRSAAAAQLVADWPAIVGPALAGVTRPQRLTGSALTIACSGPIALELQHMVGELIGQVNAHMGRTAVTRLRFVQDLVVAPRSGPAVLAPSQGVPSPIENFPPGGLHDALALLGQSVARARQKP